MSTFHKIISTRALILARHLRRYQISFIWEIIERYFERRFLLFPSEANFTPEIAILSKPSSLP